jgi:hypothetical protein
MIGPEKEKDSTLSVLVGEDGSIIAAALTPAPTSGNAPVASGLLPSDGQSIHEVKAPEELRAKLEDISYYTVSLESGSAKLTKGSASS